MELPDWLKKMLYNSLLTHKEIDAKFQNEQIKARQQKKDEDIEMKNDMDYDRENNDILKRKKGIRKIMEKDKLPPLWYAIGGFFAVPATAFVLIIGAIVLIAGWFCVPVILYAQRKKELINDERS